MFGSSFQTGDIGVEVLSPAGKLPSSKLLDLSVSGLSKEYDRDIKGYCFHISKSTTSMICPSQPKRALGLTQPLIGFQIQCLAEAPLSLELIILDTNGRKRRLHLSTNFHKIETNGELHCQIPWTNIPTSSWSNYIINMLEYTSLFNNAQFASLESFKLKSICRIRKIYTLPFPRDTLDVVIPIAFEFPVPLETPMVFMTPDYSTFDAIKGNGKESNNNNDSNGNGNTYARKKNPLSSLSNNNNNNNNTPKKGANTSITSSDISSMAVEGISSFRIGSGGVTAASPRTDIPSRMTNITNNNTLNSARKGTPTSKRMIPASPLKTNTATTAKTTISITSTTVGNNSGGNINKTTDFLNAMHGYNVNENIFNDDDIDGEGEILPLPRRSTSNVLRKSGSIENTVNDTSAYPPLPTSSSNNIITGPNQRTKSNDDKATVNNTSSNADNNSMSDDVNEVIAAILKEAADNKLQQQHVKRRDSNSHSSSGHRSSSGCEKSVVPIAMTSPNANDNNTISNRGNRKNSIKNNASINIDNLDNSKDDINVSKKKDSFAQSQEELYVLRASLAHTQSQSRLQLQQQQQNQHVETPLQTSTINSPLSIGSSKSSSFKDNNINKHSDSSNDNLEDSHDSEKSASPYDVQDNLRLLRETSAISSLLLRRRSSGSSASSRRVSNINNNSNAISGSNTDVNIVSSRKNSNTSDNMNKKSHSSSSPATVATDEVISAKNEKSAKSSSPSLQSNDNTNIIISRKNSYVGSNSDSNVSSSNKSASSDGLLRMNLSADTLAVSSASSSSTFSSSTSLRISPRSSMSGTATIDNSSNSGKSNTYRPPTPTYQTSTHTDTPTLSVSNSETSTVFPFLQASNSNSTNNINHISNSSSKSATTNQSVIHSNRSSSIDITANNNIASNSSNNINNSDSLRSLMYSKSSSSILSSTLSTAVSAPVVPQSSELFSLISIPSADVIKNSMTKEVLHAVPSSNSVHKLEQSSSSPTLIPQQDAEQPIKAKLKVRKNTPITTAIAESSSSESSSIFFFPSNTKQHSHLKIETKDQLKRVVDETSIATYQPQQSQPIPKSSSLSPTYASSNNNSLNKLHNSSSPTLPSALPQHNNVTNNDNINNNANRKDGHSFISEFYDHNDSNIIDDGEEEVNIEYTNHLLQRFHLLTTATNNKTSQPDQNKTKAKKTNNNGDNVSNDDVYQKECIELDHHNLFIGLSPQQIRTRVTKIQRLIRDELEAFVLEFDDNNNDGNYGDHSNNNNNNNNDGDAFNDQ